MRQNAHRAGFFGGLVVDIDIKALRRRYGAEGADPRRRPLQARRGHGTPQRRNRAERRSEAGGVRKRTKCQISLSTIIGIFTARIVSPGNPANYANRSATCYAC